MKKNNDGGMIYYEPLMTIVKKLNLYIETEEKIIQNIEETIMCLSDFYSGNNSKTIENKINNLKFAMSSMLNNRRDYVSYIEYIIEIYITKDENAASIFKKSQY